MINSYPIALHIFRRDLRLSDNTALIQALKTSMAVIPCFILDKRQIEKNDYKSHNSIEFMVNSLMELEGELKKYNAKLYIFYGIAEEIIAKLINQLDIKAIFVNRDYTPFSRARDQKIEKICRAHNIDFHSHADALLHEPEEVFKPNHQPYTMFTPFFKKASALYVPPPHKNIKANYYHKPIALEDREVLIKLSQKSNPNILLKGGRTEALSLLNKINKLKNYEEIRNFPAILGTTHLSAHLKFGTLSIREFHAAVVKNFNIKHTLIKELYWRDFFTHIAFHFPQVFSGPFQKKYQNIDWSTNEKHFAAWCAGQTGFPIVDAGMRELNTTGYMHNRVRMIVASFLVKDLQIDWRWGEKYFAQQLVDYDPAVNNGNWQWAASTGCDAQPYFRIFNPWLQQKKFDPACLYIKRWLPALSGLKSEVIHQQKVALVDHAKASAEAIKLYKKRS